MIVFSSIDFTFPLVNPVPKFLLILLIILFAPILFNKLKIPHLLGLIIAGAIVGNHGFNLIERDSSIILSGTAGLLYIMFLAGLEIDLPELKKNRFKSIVFGMYTFSIPMGLGFIAGSYILNFSVITSILLASMFASHTLIAYPIVSKFGITNNRAVNITIGGTIITDVLALLVLAVIVGMVKGQVNTEFWVRLIFSITVFGLIVMFLFPKIAYWFFKKNDDSISQYIFVLVMVFTGAVLAEFAGIEAIIGAFLAGLSLNPLISHTSPLMNRINFVGNAIFIPFFLLSVGMLIDYEVFFKDLNTLKVASVMVIIATSAKYLAAWLTQKTFRFSVNERRIFFGLSNAQAAATLAAVLVGYNIVIGETADGEPLRLLNQNVLNGTILMILITCTIASFVTQKGAKNIALQEITSIVKSDHTGKPERILISLSNMDTIDELINLSIALKSKENKNGLMALNIVDTNSLDELSEKQARKLLLQATLKASETDNYLQEQIRFDINIINGIVSVAREQKVTDLVLGFHIKKGISDTFLGELTEGILTKCNANIFIYKSYQTLSTIKRHLVVIPENAEKEIGFPLWLIKMWNMALNTKGKMLFYGHPNALNYISKIQSEHQIDCPTIEFFDWDNLVTLKKELKPNDNLMVILARKDQPSYQPYMLSIPKYLHQNFTKTNFILVYPMQTEIFGEFDINLTNPSIEDPMEKLETMVKLFTRFLKHK
ncbi:cation:proton antiporter [Flexithrix dorotheae]|uniref:cation:proton antiporter n=1 Tax=Flexithrix dorotheae TaxID=70993 RepID=UPI00035E3B70|nr:cation:proton antiporter [Flexithrix dorotheae]